MKKILIAATALTLLASPMAMAQPDRHDDHNNMMMQKHDDHQGGNAMMMRAGGHHDWHQGERIGRDDWGRYDRVDYHQYHLHKPPRGYEWRRVDNNYVLAAVATGLIASIIAAH